MRMSLKTKAMFGAPVALAGAFMAPARAMAPDSLYAMLAPSVWRVVSMDKDRRSGKIGSAVVIGPEILLTNCHVLKGAKSVYITHGKVSIEAHLQYADPVRDLCQIVANGLTAPAVRLGDSDRVVVGQRIYALGTPLNQELTLSDGLVSALRRDPQQHPYFIQFSAPISHGSSGGGLFDENGRLIGITSDMYEKGQNLNLAIPIKWQQDLAFRSRVALNYDNPAVRNADLPPADGVPSAPGSVPVAAPEQVPGSRPPSGFVHAVTPVASGYARIDEVDKLVALEPQADKSYAAFLKRPFPRAFALAAGGGSYAAWTSRPKVPGDDPDPAVRVLTGCEARFGRKCALYAVDDVVVYRKPDSPAAQ